MSRKINVLKEEPVAILPPSVSGYNCSPEIQITKDGLLTVNSQLSSSNREYLCSADDINGTFTVELNIFGKNSKQAIQHTYILIAVSVCHTPEY